MIVDYKEYSLAPDNKDAIMDIANQYCRDKVIEDNENLEIKLLDDEIAENFIEKIFNNMKVIRGLITKD